MSDDVEFPRANEESSHCGAFHPEYGFTCVLYGEHVNPHFDPAGGWWDKTGQLLDGGES